MQQKSFPGSGPQTLFFGGDKRQPEIRLRSQTTLKIIQEKREQYFRATLCIGVKNGEQIP